jgi:hypothetical protein
MQYSGAVAKVLRIEEIGLYPSEREVIDVRRGRRCMSADVEEQSMPCNNQLHGLV